jgi:hypothetical protein
MPVIPNTENNAVFEHDSSFPLPPPPHFDADMIAVAKPVEPLTNQAQPRRQTAMRRLWQGKFKFWLLAALSVGLLLSAGVVGMILGLQDGYAESRHTGVEPNPSVINQSVNEAPKEAVSAPQVQDSSNRPRRFRRMFRVPPALADVAPTATRFDAKPVARKIGEIFVRSGKEDRKALKRWRRQNDDDH